MRDWLLLFEHRCGVLLNDECRSREAPSERAGFGGRAFRARPIATINDWQARWGSSLPVFMLSLFS